MNPMKPPPPPELTLRRTSPGLGLLWAAPPAAGGQAAALRSRALYAGGVPLHSSALAAGLCGLRELVLPGAGSLGEEALRTCLALLRKAAPELVLRLEFSAGGLAARPLTAEAVRGFSACHPLFVHVLFDRWEPPCAVLAGQLRMLGDAGFPLAGEVFLERGRSGGTQALRSLLLELSRLGVRPYHLISGAWLPAERQVEQGEALALMKELRGWISGLAVPQLVREGTDGVRTALVPLYLQGVDNEGVELMDYRGESRRYPHPPVNPE